MRKYLFVLALMLLSMVPSLTQAQSSMSDQQLITFILQERDKGSSQSEIITKLMQMGVDIQQIQRVKRKYEKQINNAGLGYVAEESVNQAASRMRKNNGQEKSNNAVTSSNTRIQREIPWQLSYRPDDPNYLSYQSELGELLPVDSIALLNDILRERSSSQRRIFGHDLFNNENLTFEPNMNIATPQDYMLGPGDAVIVDVYGASQESFHDTVSPDGYITIEGYGPLQIGGMTVAQATTYVRSQLGTRYSSSQIRLSVGQTRTITVNIAGEVNAPGTYTMSAFSTVFNALYMAGGISNLGTLRNIKVYRNNRHISTIDVYDYILNGKATGNVKLTDNDMIIVESYDCLVNITGRVKRPMFYEMKQGESLSSLIKYSGGFASDAYRGSVRVLRKNGALRSVHTVGEFDMGTFQMADGDSVSVDSILNRYQNMCEVIGAVFRPGKYNIGGGITTVRSLLESAQLTEDAFTTRAVLHRMRPDRTLEVLAVDLGGILEERVSDVVLQNEDVLFVPSKKESIESQTISITGEVQDPGIYKYASNETLEDFILQAGGLTEAASLAKVDVARRIIDPSATQTSDTIALLYSFDLKDGFIVGGGNSAFHLEPYDVVYVRRSPGYLGQRGISLEGEVLFEGTYALSKKSERLSEVIKRAGGLTKTAYAPGARLIRKRTFEELARQEAILEAAKRSNKSSRDSIDINNLDLGPTYEVGIELDKAMKAPGSDADVVVRAGDRIVVPEYTGTVKINGEVMYPNTVSYIEGKDLEYYINQAGGWSDNSKKKKTYIVYMNGTVAKADRRHKPMPGCEIVVPTKQRGHRLSTAELLAIGTSTASIATMIATIVNVLK